ncbi:TPA: DUF927 domain-containing protein [Salmonella enterica]|nr:DUF927 domain-containing protein [Salmonella enterica]
MTGFDYLMAKGNPAFPDRHNAKDFSELCDAILNHRVQISINATMTADERKAEKRKLYWFSAATRPDATGEERRRKPENIAPCAFGTLDVDGCSPGALGYILPVAARHSVLMYRTASYTDKEPRIRLVCELSRAVEANDRKALGEALEAMLMKAAGFELIRLADSRARWERGADYAVFDRSVYSAQSYCYCPHEGALSERYYGSAIDPDALPAPVRPRDAQRTTSKAKKPKARQRDADAADFDDMNAAPDAYVIDDLKSALWFPKMLEKACSDSAWIEQGYRLASLKGTEFEDAALQLWIDWSVTAADAYPDEDLDDVAAKRWYGLDPDKTSYKAIFADAQALGWENPAVQRATARMLPHVETRDDGLYYVTPKINNQTGEIEEPAVWLCSPVSVIGRGTDGSEEYVIMTWTCNRHAVTQAIPLSETGEREGWRRMKAGGLNVTSKASLRAVLGDYLQRSGEATRWNVAKATGWQYGAYIMPDGEVIGTPSKPVIFCGQSAAAQGYTVNGTPESWRDNVASLVAGNPSMMTAVAAAFAAPLLSLVGADGFGIHFYEYSSAGKTTTANTAASVWGSPDKTKLTWYGTSLGMLNEAVAHNDGFMALDEIGQNSSRRDVAESAYALFNGVGKLQGRREGGNREIMRFTTLALSTGETDLESFIREDGGRVNAGQLVRLLSIPLTRATSFHTLPDGAAHADALKSAWQSHHGATGRKWVSLLADNRKAAQEAVVAAKNRWKAMASGEYGEQAGRVAYRFAILEAALILSQPLTGWEAGDCRAAIKHSFSEWVALYGKGNRERVQLVDDVENFLLMNESRFDVIAGEDDYYGPITDTARRAGWVAVNGGPDGRNVYYVLPGVFKDEVVTGKDPTQAARTLHEAGVLWKKDKTKYQSLTPRIGGKQCRAYALMLAPVSDDQDDDDQLYTQLI